MSDPVDDNDSLPADGGQPADDSSDGAESLTTESTPEPLAAELPPADESTPELPTAEPELPAESGSPELPPASADSGSIDFVGDVDPAEFISESNAPALPPAAKSMPAVDPPAEIAPMDWYILKVAFNREDSIAAALEKRVKMEGMEEDIAEIVVPTEDIVKFTREGKRRITQQKLLPGYICVRMRINDDTWFLVRETGGISDFTGAAGKPMPMEPAEVERFVNRPVVEDEDEEPQMKIGIPFKVGDRVRVKEGNFENQEGDVDSVDETNGRITVIINIFDRSVPMELHHWQVEPL